MSQIGLGCMCRSLCVFISYCVVSSFFAIDAHCTFSDGKNITVMIFMRDYMPEKHLTMCVLDAKHRLRALLQ